MGAVVSDWAAARLFVVLIISSLEQVGEKYKWTSDID